jgi:hypothetical protein
MAPGINEEYFKDLPSFINTYELYYIFFVVLNLNTNNIKFTGAPHCALTLKLNHEHFSRVAVHRTALNFHEPGIDQFCCLLDCMYLQFVGSDESFY